MAKPDNRKAELIASLDAEINQFSSYFASVSKGGSLAPFEREILRAFIHWQREVKVDDSCTPCPVEGA